MTLKKWLDSRQQELLTELLEIRECSDEKSSHPPSTDGREVVVVSQLDIIQEIKTICHERGRY